MVVFVKKIFKSNIVLSTLTQFLSLLLQFYVIFFILKRIHISDFAYVSYSIMGIGIFETILGAGLTQYIIYKNEICEKELSEIFSVFMLLSIFYFSILLTILLCLKIPSIEIFFSIFFILISIPFIAYNRYMVSIYQKNIEFKKIFISEAFSTIVVFTCILFCSFFFNYYLILFSIVYFLRLFFISLYFLKYNEVPKISFSYNSLIYYSKVQFIKDYSFFTFLKYFVSSIDLWLTSLFFNKNIFAQFSYSRKLYDNCLNILQIPLGKLVFSEIVHLKNNNYNQQHTIDKYVFITTSFFFFTFFLLNTLPDSFFLNLFGIQWNDGINYLKTFSFGLPFLYISILGGEILKAHGELKGLSVWSTFQIILTIIVFSIYSFISFDLLLKFLIFLRSVSILFFFIFFKFESHQELKHLFKYKVLRNLVIVFLLVFVMNFLAMNLQSNHYNIIFILLTSAYTLFLFVQFKITFNKYY